MPQMMFHIKDYRTCEIIKLMKRQSKYRTTIKARKTGKDSDHLLAEEQYLNERPELLDALKSGEVVYC